MDSNPGGSNWHLVDDDAPHKKGVALIISKEAGKSLKESEPEYHDHLSLCTGH